MRSRRRLERAEDRSVQAFARIRREIRYLAEIEGQGEGPACVALTGLHRRRRADEKRIGYGEERLTQLHFGEQAPRNVGPDQPSLFHLLAQVPTDQP